jgi:hypothetical protein
MPSSGPTFCMLCRVQPTLSALFFVHAFVLRAGNSSTQWLVVVKTKKSTKLYDTMVGVEREL